MTADTRVRDRGLAAEASRLLSSGQPVPPEMRATSVWMEKGKKGQGKFPDLFYANGWWVVSREVAEILRGFDLGEGGLYPLEVLQSDRVTPVGGEWLYWIFGNRKDTLDTEASRNLRVHSPVPGDPWRKLASHPADDDATFSQAALVGPDVWIEKRLKGAVVLSGGLGDALLTAGFDKSFRMTRARVMQGE